MDLKNLLTTIAGVGYLVVTTIQQYLATVQPGGSINWLSLLSALAVAVIGYFIGKNPDGTAKTAAQVSALNAGK